MKRSRLILAIGALLAVVVGGTFALTGPTPISPEDLRPTAEVMGEGVLDRMTFVGHVGTSKNPKRTGDTFVFDKGLFVSKECERICKFPARPYFVREKAGGIEFISETRCPYKDSKIVWRGTFKDGKVKGTSTWTSRRWYWTIEEELHFEGTLSAQSTSIPLQPAID